MFLDYCIAEIKMIAPDAFPKTSVKKTRKRVQ
jgi:hypothetical protein